MKATEVTALVVDAFEKGHARGARDAHKERKRQDRISRQIDRKMLFTATAAVISEEFGLTEQQIGDLMSRVMDRVEQNVKDTSKSVISTLEDAMTEMGLGDIVAQMHQVYEKDTPTGRVVGFELSDEDDSPGARHARSVLEAMLAGKDPASVTTDDPTGEKETILN